MALGAGMITAGVIAGDEDGGTPPPQPGGAISLVAYDSCDSALVELKNRIMPHVGPYGLDLSGGRMFTDAVPMAGDGAERAGQGAAPAEAPVAADQSQPGGHSTTNVHEAGVDEPDLVKTDGRRVVSITDGVLRVVDVASRKQTAVVRLDGEGGGYPTQLLLAGDRALVMASGVMAYGDRAVPEIAPGEPTPPVPDDSRPMPLESQLVLVDLTGEGAILGRLAVDGFYLDARQIGSVARVVLRSSPRLQFRYPEFANSDPNATTAQNKEIVANSAIQDWLPRYELTTGDGARTSGQLTDCADLSHPADYSASSMLTVLTFDLTRELGTGDPVSIVADGSTVYGTDKNLYVANGYAMDAAVDGKPTSGHTELYQFDIAGADKPVHVASGSVPGSLLNQYSLSEHDGHLRVATTTTTGGDDSQSMITVLARNGNRLNQVGQVGGLGVGERIYAVRYFGATAYVVTFRQTDPLYTVDLSDPAAPKVTGELKITGYSAYLHPAGDGRLLGVGQEADKDGRATGAQISLFDTSNRSGATRLAQYHLRYSWTDVEGDPHAFLYWPAKGLVLLPIVGGFATEEGGEPEHGGGMLVLRLKDSSFEEVATISHDQNGAPMVPQRALVIGDELWTVSSAGMKVNDLDSVAQLAWVPFS